MHIIRDNASLPLPNPSVFHDIVIAGGGISGLTSAFKLKDEDFLLLERESVVGGNAKKGEYKGVNYALGAAYLVDTDEPFGSFYEEIDVNPKAVVYPTDMGFFKGKWQPLEAGPIAKPFNKLKNHLARMLESPDFPPSNIREASVGALKLDKISFYDYLQFEYPPEIIRCINAYCYSALGGNIREISAYAGINFYSEITGDIHAFPGGNAYIVDKLLNRLKKSGSTRIKTGVSVYNIAQHGDKVRTSYFLNEDPSTIVTVESRAVVIAMPYFFAARIFKNLSPVQRQLMRAMQYGSYLVANCCFDKNVFDGGYDNWTPDNHAFTDFIIADYVNTKGKTDNNKNKASVITVYAPFRSPQTGRAMLFEGNRKSLSDAIVKQLHAVTGFSVDTLKEVHLSRYGHQLLTSRVGLINILAKMPSEIGRVVLAHSDGFGMASIESAILAGLAGAKSTKAIIS